MIDWRSVYEVNASDLLRFLRRLTKDTQTAEDLLQDAFARAMGASHLPTSADVRPWLYRIAANVALSELRRRPIPFMRPSQTDMPPIEEIEQVRRILRSLPPEQAVTLTLVLHEGFSRRETASLLGISEETVKSRLARGRANFIATYRRLERGLSG